MTRETYFSPGTAPLERFARGVYGALPKSLEEANQMFNPLELLREAGGKSRRFFESGGRDRKAGIEALIDTATLGVGPASVGLASLFKTPVKKGTDFAQDAIQEAFNPLGASDDRVVDTGKKGMSRRDFLGGTGAAMALAGAPILKEAGDILPMPKPKAKIGILKSTLEEAKNISKAIQNIYDERDEFVPEGFLDDSYDVFENELDKATIALNNQLETFTKNMSYDDLMKLSDEELKELNKLKHISEHRVKTDKFGEDRLEETTGDPLRTQYNVEDGVVTESKEISDLIDKVLKERDLYDPLVDMDALFKAQGGVVSLRDEARNMFRKPRGIASLTV